jgi:hypothetical protein
VYGNDRLDTGRFRLARVCVARRTSAAGCGAQCDEDSDSRHSEIGASAHDAVLSVKSDPGHRVR